MSKAAVIENQSDRLLMLAAAVVVGVGLTWLLISQPWSSGASPRPGTERPAALESAEAAPSPVPRKDVSSGQTQLSTGLNNPLRMAQLAYDAGMLVEPEDYSAWALFSKVLDEEPENAEAKDGLGKVATDLLARSEVALEQGRYEDARDTVEKILGVLPEHEGARALAARIEAEAPKPAPAKRAAVAAEPPAPEIKQATAPAPKPVLENPAEQKREPQPDPLIALDEAFQRAMRENRLLAPPNDSARTNLQKMIQADPDDARTAAARDLYITELLARSKQALEALDTDAARTWIDAAALVAIDQGRIVEARIALNDRLIAMESANPVPASDFEIVEYVAPEYPRLAANRGLEGWVDLEFTVAADGTTRDIVVADASQERYFRDEAIAAVRQWRFKPRIYMGQAIDQRTFTRLRFVLTSQ